MQGNIITDTLSSKRCDLEHHQLWANELQMSTGYCRQKDIFTRYSVGKPCRSCLSNPRFLTSHVTLGYGSAAGSCGHFSWSLRTTCRPDDPQTGRPWLLPMYPSLKTEIEGVMSWPCLWRMAEGTGLLKGKGSATASHVEFLNLTRYRTGSLQRKGS